MLLPLVFMFTVLPMLELFFLIRAGQIIGLWNTVGVVLVTGVVGAAFARSQGQAIWRQVSGDLNKGVMPADALFHGAMVFAGGLLLVTPGFITDILGLSFVMPGTRHLILASLKKLVESRIQSGQFKVYHSSYSFGQGPVPPKQNQQNTQRPVRDVIDISPITEKKSESSDN